MTVRVTQGGRSYLVEAPAGCRFIPLPSGQPAMAIPGQGPGETSLWLPVREVLHLARLRVHGLSLRGGDAAPTAEETP